jgi:hypothetical protein
MLDLQTLSVVSCERYEERLRQAAADQRYERKLRAILKRMVRWLTHREAAQPAHDVPSAFGQLYGDVPLKAR